MSSQCPTCRYFTPFEPQAEDDAGYKLPGLCRHPQIAMELFLPRDRPELSSATCDLRWPVQPLPTSERNEQPDGGE